MVKSKRYVFVKHFDGFPKKENFELVEEELEPIKDGEFLAEAVYISIDPFTKAFANANVGLVKPGDTFGAIQIARIIESKNPSFEVGKYIRAFFGCRTHTISNGSNWKLFPVPLRVLNELDNLPMSLYLGVLGLTGVSAYYGLTEICKPKEGETIVISTAAGATGNHAGQLAKTFGCKVIGLVGSDEKGRWITEELDFDHYINYKTADLSKELKEKAPMGVDMYFDNVGGEISFTVISQMNKFGRIAACGMLCTLNVTTVPTAPIIQSYVILRELKMEGFFAPTFADKWEEIEDSQLKLIKEGKLKYRETVTEGFENHFEAFTDMFNGKNFGKTILKL